MRIFIMFALLSVCTECLAQVYQPGFRTVGNWTEDPPTRLDLNIWYPAVRQPKDQNYPPWTLNVSLNAKPAEGRFPLLLLSHASPADRFAYHSLASQLARDGFVVAAPTHKSDNMNNMDDLFTWAQLKSRVNDLEQAIKLVLAEKDLASVADSARIGVIGFGSGGTAALLIGGALPECEPWANYCQRAGTGDPYCSPWARDRLDATCASFPLRQSLANPRVKAIAAIAPGFGMIFGQNSFKYFYPPLLLVAAGRDNFNRAMLHCQPIAAILGAKARFLDLPEADAGALISTCPQQLVEELPELCQSVPAGKRRAIQSRLEDTLVAFFSHYLKITANLPKIPEPPVFEEPAAPKKETPKETRRKRK